MATSTIGTDKNYTTIQLWEDYLTGIGTLTENMIGECQTDENHSGGVDFNGVTPGAYRVTLTVQDDLGSNRHRWYNDSHHPARSWNAKAHIDTSGTVGIHVQDPAITIEYLPVRATGSGAFGISLQSGASGTVVHACIAIGCTYQGIHNPEDATADIRNCYAIRNGRIGIYLKTTGDPGGTVRNNTVVANGRHGFSFEATTATLTVTDNISVGNNTSAGAYYDYNGTAECDTFSRNVSSDATGGDDAAGAWATSTSYATLDCVTNDSETYICHTAHTSGDEDDEPGTGTVWQDYWTLLTNRAWQNTVSCIKNYEEDLRPPRDADTRKWPSDVLGLACKGFDNGSLTDVLKVDGGHTWAVSADAKRFGDYGLKCTVVDSGAGAYCFHDLDEGAQDDGYALFATYVPSSFTVVVGDAFHPWNLRYLSVVVAYIALENDAGTLKFRPTVLQPTTQGSLVTMPLDTWVWFLVRRLKDAGAGIQVVKYWREGTDSAWQTNVATSSKDTSAYGVNRFAATVNYNDAGTYGDIYHDHWCFLTSEPDGPPPYDYAGAHDATGYSLTGILIGGNGSGTDIVGQTPDSNYRTIGAYLIDAAPAAGGSPLLLRLQTEGLFVGSAH